jgi:hypothetical protein
MLSRLLPGAVIEAMKQSPNKPWLVRDALLEEWAGDAGQSGGLL